MARTEVRLVENDSEREALYAFRYAVYVEEMEMTRQADHARRALHDEYDDASLNYAVFEDGRIVGSLRCIYLDSVADPRPLIEKFAMAPALDAFGPGAILTTSRFIIAHHLRNSMAIFRLMQAAFRDALAAGKRLNYGDCSPHLLPFYEHLGYRRYTAGFNDTDFGYKVPILMLTRDRAFLGRVRSPLARLVDEDADDPEARGWFGAAFPDYAGEVSAMFMPNEMFFDLLAERVADDPLHSMSLLRGLSKEDAARFLSKAAVIRVQPGDRIIRKGERDNTLFVLLSGAAQVRAADDGRPPIAMLSAGDTFGEVGYLATVPRSADVVACAEGEVVVLSGAFMDQFVAQEPAIGARVLHNLARELAGRLAVATQRLSGEA